MTTSSSSGLSRAGSVRRGRRPLRGIEEGEDRPSIVAAAPDPGEGFWYLVRAVNACGPGTYDSGGTMQAAPRDPGIAASPAACP